MSTYFATLISVLTIVLLPSIAAAQTQSAHYEQGVQAYAEGEYTEAYIHLKNALQVDSRFLPARVLLAKVHFNAGDIAGAAKESEEALALGADLNLVLPIYGTALILQRRTTDLLALEKQVHKLTEENQFEWALLKGQGLLQRGERDSARREFERAAQMFPADVRSNNSLAAVYIQSGLREEAAELIEKSLLLDPNSVKTLELNAELALIEGHREKAQESLEKAFALDSSDLRILRGLARLHLLNGEQEQIEHYLNLILEQSPSDPAATLLSAIMEIQKGEAELGDAMLSGLSLKLSELGAILPQSGDRMLFIQAAADYVRGSDRSAISLFNNYLTRNGRDLAAIRMLSDVYVRNGEYSRAKDLLSSSRDVIVQDLGLMVQLLRLYIEAGAELSAREILEDVRPHIEEELFVAVLEAELNRSVGKPEEAIKLLDELDYAQVPATYGLLRGAILLDLNRLNDARVVAVAMQKAFPRLVRAHNLAAVTYLRRGELEPAEAAIESALNLSEKDVDARFNRAMLLKMRGELNSASQQLNDILNETPGHIRSIMLMANILLDQGKQEEAIDWSRKVYAYDKTSMLPDEFQLKAYTRAENWSEALKTVAQLTKEDPLNEDFLVQQAEIYLILRDFEVAQRPLRSLFALWEHEPQKLRALADMQVRAENLPEARLSLETALKLDSKSLDTQLALARLNVLEEKFDRASGQLELMEKTFGPRSEISLISGDIAAARKDLETAQSHYMRSFKLGTNATAVVKLYELSLQGIGGKAFVETMEATLKESSLPPWAVRLLADSHLTQGNTQSASRYYELLLTHPQFENDAGVLNNLANIYAEDDLGRALLLARQALSSQEEDNPALLDTVGWILTRQQQFDEALPYLRKAFALNSRDSEVRYHTAVALLGLKRTVEAEKELRAALAGGAQFSGREEAQRLLDELPK